MGFCCNTYRDYQLVLNKGINFVNTTIKWLSQFVLYHTASWSSETENRDINKTIGYCYLTRSRNKTHTKSVSNEHLGELCNCIGWTLFITITPIYERSFFFIRHDKLPKLLKLFINHTNTPLYDRTHQTTFDNDLLILSLLYILKLTEHPHTTDLVLHHLSQLLKCDFLKPLTKTSTIFDTIQTYAIHN